MKTDKKFTVILSAYTEANSQIQNLIDSEALYNKLANLQGGFVNPIRAVGVYAGKPEQSFVIHTSAHTILEQVKFLAFEYNQECVLVSKNRDNHISLHYPTGKSPMHLGERFASACIDSLMPITVVDGVAWTVR